MDTKKAITLAVWANDSAAIPACDLEHAWDVLETELLWEDSAKPKRIVKAMNMIARELNDRAGLVVRPVMELI